ncbi:MAG: DNA cytosine methyltransferase, partial [Cyclobacteriaceae bacterium]|nr:DNA cytosine methyltransferase [Cyclobacteriaceae bacterium]
TNFPETIHDCTDISACDPRRYPKTNILITSPECTNHSLAKGQKRKNSVDMFTELDPEAERSRATMWDVPRFAEYHNYEIIIVENVVDARDWIAWEAWIKAMHLYGYEHKCVYFNSQHAHPTPQSRDRMYVVFWKKGNKAPDLNFRPKAYCSHCVKETETFQSFKNSGVKWGKYKTQYVYRCPSCNNECEPYYYAAFNLIDWSNPGTRIGDRKKPLSPNTERRIKYGIEKYWNQPQIITTRYTSGLECRVKSAVNDVLPTQPGDRSHAILNPILEVSAYPPMLTSKEYDMKKQKVKDAAKEPMFTQTTYQNTGLVMPFIIEMNRTGKARKVDKALSTVLAGGNHHGLAMPFIVENKGMSNARSMSKPIGCVTTKDYHALLTPESMKSFLSYYYNGDGVSDIKQPVNTITTKDRASIITAGTKPRYEDFYYRMLLPHEIKLGMAFDTDYIVLGNGKQQVKQLGNAVTPPVMKMILERCIETLK